MNQVDGKSGKGPFGEPTTLSRRSGLHMHCRSNINLVNVDYIILLIDNLVITWKTELSAQYSSRSLDMPLYMFTYIFLSTIKQVSPGISLRDTLDHFKSTHSCGVLLDY